jgi:hypothetical protein
MIQLDLTSEDAEMLREVLEEYFSDLRMEIAGTESMTYREELKKKEAFLSTILERLRRE